MRFMGGIFTKEDNDIVRGVIEKLGAGYDFDEKLDELSPEERFAYIGICTGINAVITMAEHQLEEKAAPVLNNIFGDNLFVWRDTTIESDSEDNTEDNTEDVSDITTEMVDEAISKAVEDTIMAQSNE